MLEHAIEATTFPGDIVLDCFAGSGSAALAALKLGRRSISIEIDPLWVTAIAERLEVYEMQNPAESRDGTRVIVRPGREVPQLSLFVPGK